LSRASIDEQKQPTVAFALVGWKLLAGRTNIGRHVRQ
jgi:hypothetical protein